MAHCVPQTGRTSRWCNKTHGRKDREIFKLEVYPATSGGVSGAGRLVAAGGGTDPKKGGILKFVVPDEPPSSDGHRETTFALAHPWAPFYSLLIRIDPEDKAAQAIVCDLCTEMPKPTDGGKTYTFKIRPGVKFHDGSALTAKDVHASFQRIVFPQQGVSSARKAQFSDGREHHGP